MLSSVIVKQNCCIHTFLFDSGFLKLGFGENMAKIIFLYRGAKQNLCIHSQGNQFSCMYTTEMGNTAKERKFCGLFGDIFKNCEKMSYEAQFAFVWHVVEFAN